MLDFIHLTAKLYFNPLPSYEGRRVAGSGMLTFEYISIHSPHTRGDETAALSP